MGAVWTSDLIGSSMTRDSLRSAQEKTGKHGEICKQCERTETPQKKKMNIDFMIASLEVLR